MRTSSRAGCAGRHVTTCPPEPGYRLGPPASRRGKTAPPRLPWRCRLRPGLSESRRRIGWAVGSRGCLRRISASAAPWRSGAVLELSIIAPLKRRPDPTARRRRERSQFTQSFRAGLRSIATGSGARLNDSVSKTPRFSKSFVHSVSTSPSTPRQYLVSVIAPVNTTSTDDVLNLPHRFGAAPRQSGHKHHRREHREQLELSHYPQKTRGDASLTASPTPGGGALSDRAAV